ncbi:MAG: HAMP domain-containing protein [candidate division Zixibacteria bacterium]|nr:HAMP domain-containing protein [candidate division Zixibacteria bacterium]MBU1470226.1 HAMP domain-containing protein [candidate division Zixibacteria bacterium]MBU2626759.1 HAMP domain-containing protein [candidate division Zixibacteria bacterium]
MNFRDSSLRNKLTMIAMIASIVGLTLSGAVFMIIDYHTLKATMVRNLETLSSVIGSNCTAAISFHNAEDASDVLTALKAEEHIIGAVIYGNDDLVLAYYARDDQAGDFRIPPVNEPCATFSDGTLSVYHTISLDDERIGTIYMQSDLRQVSSRMIQIGTAILLITAFCFVVVFVIISRLQRVVSQPILNLARTARIISQEKYYSARVDYESKDELGILVSGFNEMLVQIQKRDSELLESRDKLEERVRERTVELEEEIKVRKQAEQAINKSLKEKEILLKEVHHRVKNNLQIIMSLLSLQSNGINGSHIKEMFRDSQRRVKSMALIHEKLYQSENLAEIDLAEYIESLSKYLLSTITGNMNKIRMVTNVERITLGVDKAVPCGLIINELVTNSLKYAFNGRDSGQITITCKKLENDQISLSVADDGIGIPENMDYKNTQSLGLQLVNNLSNQLGAKIDLQAGLGYTCFNIVFKGADIGREEQQLKSAEDSYCRR